jgi:hypothetical protein
LEGKSPVGTRNNSYPIAIRRKNLVTETESQLEKISYLEGWINFQHLIEAAFPHFMLYRSVTESTKGLN